MKLVGGELTLLDWRAATEHMSFTVTINGPLEALHLSAQFTVESGQEYALRFGKQCSLCLCVYPAPLSLSVCLSPLSVSLSPHITVYLQLKKVEGEKHRSVATHPLQTREEVRGRDETVGHYSH